MRLEKRIAIITGAGGGIGRAGALAFAREGARVVVSDLDAARGDETAALVRARGGEAIAIAADAGRPADVRRLVEETVARLGGLDILYNNAGIAPLGKDGFTPAIAEEDWDWVIRVNLTSVFLCCKYAIPVMAHRPGAAIINMASSMAVLPAGLTDAYAASKGGVATLTRSMAPGCGLLGIRVNALAPGTTDTDMVRNNGPEAAQRMAEISLMRRAAHADEMVGPALFLCSDAGSFVTGALVVADGGYATAR